MNLGGNAESCKAAFVKAMRDRLEAEKEGLGDNLNDPSVRSNLEALGQAVYDILTENAETVSLSPTTPDEPDEEGISIWTWIQDINDWLQELHTWHQSVATALETDPPPAPPTNVPTEIRGRIQ